MMMDWFEITVKSLQSLWQGFLEFVPQLIGALIVFLIGWFIAIGIGNLIAEILKRLQFNKIFERELWKEALEKAELKINASEFIGGICKWVLVIVFLYAAVGILNWVAFGEILKEIVNYLPNVVVAALIFVVAVIISDIVEKVVRVGLEGSKFIYASISGVIIKWAIWIFAVLAILRQLLVIPTLIDIVFGALITGVIAFLVISLGLAFGLGGKDVAAEILENLKRRIKK